MDESIKAVAALVLIIATVAAVFAWVVDGSGTAVWAFRISAPAIAVLSLATILSLHYRSDLEQDYLRSVAGTYFNRDGFCFTLNMVNIQGTAHMEAYYQNQFDGPSIGRIAVRPARGFWMNRPHFSAVTYKIVCQPAAFGVTRVPIPIPTELQGRSQTFEVGASVLYPDGKGNRVRYFDGIFLRTNTNFDKKWDTAVTVFGAAGGGIVLSSPATATIAIPSGVSENVPSGLEPQAMDFWKLGDPPLELNDDFSGES
ncbi:MAG: hypothetical protein RIC12_01715 [Pirellulales bacterium]